MKRWLTLAFLIALLALMAVQAGCTPEPAEVEATPYQLPTPRLSYEVIGSTKNTIMVLIDPADRNDREGLQALSEFLCFDGYIRCQIWYWDDAALADDTYPLDPASEAALVAEYFFNLYTDERTLTLYPPAGE